MKKSMWVARIHKVHKLLKIERIPIPQIGPQDVLLHVKACGICHSDLHIMEGITPLPKYPMTIGHEFAGVIQEVGSEVKNWKAGQRVCIYSTIGCGDCFFCLKGREALCLSRNILGVHLDGGYAQFVRVPAKCLVQLPEKIPFDQGAILTDAVATPFHAIVKRSQMALGDTVVIFGIGGLGSHAVQIAKINGAAKVIAVDILDSAIKKAKQFGADVVIDGKRDDPVKAIRKATGGLGADVAFEFVGIKKTVEQAIASVRRGGRVVVSGIGDEQPKLPPPAVFTRSEIEVVGSYGFEKSEIKKIVEMVSEGKLDLSHSISHRITLDQANDGLRLLKEGKGEVLRIVILFN
jgi:propanol-preferring alcohol dehydrogenase